MLRVVLRLRSRECLVEIDCFRRLNVGERFGEVGLDVSNVFVISGKGFAKIDVELARAARVARIAPLGFRFSERKGVGEIVIENFSRSAFNRGGSRLEAERIRLVRPPALVRVQVLRLVGERIRYVERVFVTIISKGILRKVRQLRLLRHRYVAFTRRSWWSRSISRRFWLKQVFVTGQFRFTEKVEENDADTVDYPPAAGWPLLTLRHKAIEGAAILCDVRAVSRGQAIVR